MRVAQHFCSVCSVYDDFLETYQDVLEYAVCGDCYWMIANVRTNTHGMFPELCDCQVCKEWRAIRNKYASLAQWAEQVD